MKIYNVQQGMMTSGGSGDFINFGEFATKKEAIKKFNEIKKDIRGYANKPSHGYLLTTIEVYEGALGDPESWEYIDTIELLEYRWY